MGRTITFHGGAGTVTGSRFLVDDGRTRVLVDCGLFQGLKELRLRNWDRPPFDPASVDHVVLTHVHIDHSGYLPKFVREGFKGPVHVTPASADLAGILLMDAAKIQEEDAERANRKGYTKHHPALPLYDESDVEAALRLLKTLDYGEEKEIAKGVRIRFHNAGHILGSAHVELILGEGERARRILFSGDVGRYGVPLHRDPAPPPPADVLVMESTYGDRLHEDVDFIEQIREPVQETFAAGGTVLIPAFAVARAQLVTLLLNRAIADGRLPEAKIHIDSPMAVDASAVYAMHADRENLDADVARDPRKSLYPDRVRFHRSVDESKFLNRLHGGRFIIASSGMLTGGRVLHHLERLLPNPKNLLILVGFQAAGTRGRALLEGAETLRIHGQDVPVRCRFLNAHGLSAHADRDGLLRWVRAMGRPPETMYLVHGEAPALEALGKLLAAEFPAARIHIPAHGETAPV